MNKTRFETGMENLKKIDGDSGNAVIHSLENISPDLGTYIVEFAFGDIYARHGLTLQEREIITLASLLTAGGCEPQLEVHISAALHVGLSKEKIIETFLQCIPYTGLPKVQKAKFTADKLYQKLPRYLFSRLPSTRVPQPGCCHRYFSTVHCSYSFFPSKVIACPGQ